MHTPLQCDSTRSILVHCNNPCGMDIYPGDGLLQMFDDTNEISQTLSSSVAAPYVTVDSDDLDRELDSLLDDHTSVG